MRFKKSRRFKKSTAFGRRLKKQKRRNRRYNTYNIARGGIRL